mmetsp:Transcript_24072/g.39890  ORF Transcript_24072/g.39890 Transcript_24072/m.39890 type:complete len:478 (+) Transcript_24072:450-1883(+)
MEAQDPLVLGLEADQLAQAHGGQVHVLLGLRARVRVPHGGAVGGLQLQRAELEQVRLDVLLPVPRDGLLLAEPAAAVLEGREHGGGHQVVVHLLAGAAVQPLGQQDARAHRHGRQLQPPVQHVPHRVDVGHVGGLGRVRAQELAVRLGHHARALQVEAGGVGVPAGGEEHGVEQLGPLLPLAREAQRHLDLAAAEALVGRGHALLVEPGAHRLHVRADLLGALLVEAPEEDGAHGHRHGVPQLRQEARALQRDVRGAHHQRLPGGGLRGEDVVAGEADLPRPGHVGDDRPAAHRDEEALGGGLVLLALDYEGYFVRSREGCQSIEILDSVRLQAHSVSKVQHLHMVLDRIHHFFPVVPWVLSAPSKVFGIVERSPHQGSVMHQFFRYAANVHTCSAKPPLGPLRGWFYKVKKGNLGSKLGCFFRCSHASRTAANDDKIVFIFRGCHHFTHALKLKCRAGVSQEECCWSVAAAGGQVA